MRTTPGCDEIRLEGGWLPDLDIPAAYAALEHLLPADGLVLVTSLDSERDMSKIGGLLAWLEATSGPRFLDGGLLLARHDLANLIRDQNYFVGFDELWLFDAAPSVGKPQSIALTSELHFEMSPDVVQWFRSSGALLGLGDGDGLNFITCWPEIARHLRSLTTG
jgi:hypothetical protein